MQTHTQGEVVLHAIIGRDGAVSSLQAVSGHPLLVPAALDAVRQWRYKPYTLNSEPVEVETFDYRPIRAGELKTSAAERPGATSPY